jgi:hypothetical protein
MIDFFIPDTAVGLSGLTGMRERSKLNHSVRRHTSFPEKI